MTFDRAALLLLTTGVAAALGQTVAWKTVSPERAGLDGAKLDAWRNEVAALRTSGLLVIRRGVIAYEWYAPAAGPDKQHGTASLAKALVGGMSLLVAISDGALSPDDLASRYIPAWRDDPLKSKITIRHLATHTAGIEDAELDDIPHMELPGWKGAFWRRDPDPFSISVRQAPVLFEPGWRNAYSNPGMAALAYAVTASLKGGDIRELLKRRIMDPLGIPESAWSIGYGRAYDVDGLRLYATWGGGSYTARAAASVARLLMLGGRWNGRELVRREAVKQTLTYAGMPKPARTKDDPAPASGLAWYVNSDGVWPEAPRDAFAGAGAGHQVVIAIPSLDLIAVRNGDAMGDPKAGFWGPVYQKIVRPLMAAVVERGPYPASPAIAKVVFDADIKRMAIDSDNWPITWADDDAQYTSYGDGWGFEPRVEKKLGMGFARITGSAADFRGVNLRSDGERVGNGANSPKASGMLMVGGVLYLWVRNVGNAQLAWSKDHGKTWTWGFKMERSFGSPSFLNFGRNYAGSRDGYVYTYSQDGESAYESDNGIVLARVPRDRMTDRRAWEYFERLDERGRPLWTADLGRRGAVFEKPGGCQRVDVVYNPGLRRYLMALGYNHDGAWGIFDAPEPWGPWTTVLHSDGADGLWDLRGTHGYRLPAKWIGAGGLRMTLIFSGIKPNDAFCTREMRLERR